MFTKSSEIYDIVYSWKDYIKEARQVADLIAQHRPNTKTILDVACGTHQHAVYLTDRFHIDGLDLNPVFLELAKHKNPAGTYFEADMTNFDLGRTYDTLMCVFSSIGYVVTVERLRAALKCFRKHLDVGGLCIVEPWFRPDTFNEGKVYMLPIDKPDIKICRMGTSTVSGNVSRLYFYYLVGTSEGITYFEETHDSGLFTIEQMTDAFRAAGFEVDYQEPGLMGRGLYIAKAI
jgi:ubiquinone/menaquinone biosynthesis C-methylase UbiE